MSSTPHEAQQRGPTALFPSIDSVRSPLAARIRAPTALERVSRYDGDTFGTATGMPSSPSRAFRWIQLMARLGPAQLHTLRCTCTVSSAPVPATGIWPGERAQPLYHIGDRRITLETRRASVIHRAWLRSLSARRPDDGVMARAGEVVQRVGEEVVRLEHAEPRPPGGSPPERRCAPARRARRGLRR
jgi:hypothetical protein